MIDGFSTFWRVGFFTFLRRPDNSVTSNQSGNFAAARYRTKNLPEIQGIRFASTARRQILFDFRHDFGSTSINEAAHFIQGPLKPLLGGGNMRLQHSFQPMSFS